MIKIIMSSKSLHRILLFFAVATIILVAAYLTLKGFSFYKTAVVQRFFHPDYKILKPGGIYGHGYGIIGSAFILFGVTIYMVRKRVRSLFRFGLLKYWLEFHIFLCTLGPILVLYHTSFKFGGIVAISFWSMVAVVMSGVIGRFIYIQIPRSLEGRQLSLTEVNEMTQGIAGELHEDVSLDDESIQKIVEITKKKTVLKQRNFLVASLNSYSENRKLLRHAKSIVKQNDLSSTEYKNIVSLVKNKLSLNRKIERLTTMQNLLKHWHILHLPFAFIMLIVMIIHVVITVMFGSRWIF
jgi:hypothetical protein